jgi:hypothetical protein
MLGLSRVAMLHLSWVAALGLSWVAALGLSRVAALGLSWVSTLGLCWVGAMSRSWIAALRFSWVGALVIGRALLGGVLLVLPNGSGRSGDTVRIGYRACRRYFGRLAVVGGVELLLVLSG